MRGWTRHALGFYTHPKVAGIVDRRRLSMAGMQHDASRRVKWCDRAGNQRDGWVIVQGIHARGVFPTLRQAMRFARRNAQVRED